MSKPISEKKNVRILVDLCLESGIKDVVISPGSRNAPLILSFSAIEDFKCFNIVDERSAAFFALGMAQQSGKAVALVCTSGTAVLNYAPAIAEAYYQGVPLLVITADRPGEWIDQADGQTIRQHGIYSNYIKYSCTLPVDILNKDDEWHAERLISEAIMYCNKELPGPVHINIPFREPLYGRTVHQNRSTRKVKLHKTKGILSENDLSELTERWKNTERVMILAGMRKPDSRFKAVIDELSSRERIAVLTETLTNCHIDGAIRCIDRVVSSIREEEMALFKPDLLITFDGPIVSKMVKTFLRNNPPKEHWHISESGEFIDTYRNLSRVIEGDPVTILQQLSDSVVPVKSRYKDTWQNRFENVTILHNEYIKNLPWSDFYVFNFIIENLPKSCVLQLGNSTPVRYAQLFDDFNGITSYSNRGTSGIDGCVSTAIGAANCNTEPVILITGDLSFFYDSNALWNQYIPDNLKIIVVNNGGGGIFRFIPGPSDTEELEQFFASGHSMNGEHIAMQYNIDYSRCENSDDLKKSLQVFLNKKSVAILEIMTPVNNNARVLKDYFSLLKK